MSDRLRRFNGLDSTPLYHPPLLADRLTPASTVPYVLSVARLEGNKRVDLIVRAMAHVPEPLTLVVVGDGSHRHLIERAAEEAGVTARVRFAGAVHDDDLVTLYRDALALVYVPFDEDYGLATLEAFLAAKPVVTAADSGGTLEFVKDEHQRAGLRSRPAGDRRGAGAAGWGSDARRPARGGRAVAGPRHHLGHGDRPAGEPWLTPRRSPS